MQGVGIKSSGAGRAGIDGGETCDSKCAPILSIASNGHETRSILFDQDLD